MKKQIEIIKNTRAFLLEKLKDLDTKQLNKIPEGFNNNIIWNLGHLVAAQQGVCYVKAGLTPPVNEDFINTYKTGTKPEKFVSETEIENIKSLMFTTLDQLETDYNNHIFGGYIPWMTRYNVELTSIEDTIDFISFHEGLHSGCSLALKKLVTE